MTRDSDSRLPRLVSQNPKRGKHMAEALVIFVPRRVGNTLFVLLSGDDDIRHVTKVKHQVQHEILNEGKGIQGDMLACVFAMCRGPDPNFITQVVWVVEPSQPHNRSPRLLVIHLNELLGGSLKIGKQPQPDLMYSFCSDHPRDGHLQHSCRLGAPL